MEIATIDAFVGSFGSGIATLVFQDAPPVHGDNGPMVRALENMFPGFITPGHMVDNNRIAGQQVAYATDELGLLLYLADPRDALVEGALS